MINQSAGAGNLQRNSVQLGTAAPGVETVSDRELSATAAKNGGQGLAIGVHSVREATISNDAFKNVNGIVQINQTAGAGIGGTISQSVTGALAPLSAALSGGLGGLK